VRAQLTGFRTVEQGPIDVHLGERLEITLTLGIGVEETVDVVAVAPVVDVRSTTTGTNVDANVLTQIPMSRKMTDVLYVAPGVSSSGGVGRANASIGGASGLENLYNVDGVNITNTGNGGVGSYSGTFGSLGTAIPYDFIDEIQVKTAGIDAEYGQSTGGVVNVITRSGGNSLRGSVFGYTQLDALEAPWKQITLQEGRVNTTGTQSSDLGVTIGGPIRQNKVFYFVAVNPAWTRDSFIAPEGFPLRSEGDVDRNRRTLSYAAKVTFEMSESQRLNASFFGDPSRGESGPQRSSALLGSDTSRYSKIKYGGDQQALRYSWVITPKWFLEASVSRSANTIEETPALDEWSIVDYRVSPALRQGGLGSFLKKNPGSNIQYSVKATHEFGMAQLRYGFLFEDISFDEYSYLTGPQITLPDGRQSASGASVEIRSDPTFGEIYRVNYATIGGAVRETTQDYLAFFVQPTFNIRNRLTIAPGLRYDRQTLSGTASYSFTGNWAPRIGVTYDPTGSGRAKIFVHWGRFFNKLPNNTAARSLTAIPDVRLADYFDPDLTQPVPNGVEALGTTVHFRTASGGVSDVRENSKAGYLDEIVIGTEQEFGGGLKFGLRYTRRDVKRVFEDIANAAMILYYMPEANVDSLVYFLGNPDDGFPETLDDIGAFEAPVRTYDAVEITGEKRFTGRWSVFASYRWSRIYGTYEGYYLNDTGESNPGLLSLYDFPTDDPTYTEIGGPQFGFRGDIRYLGKLGAGPLPNDRRHQFKVYGSYVFDFDLNLGIGLTAGSGRPLTPMAANPVYTGIAGIPEEPRGSGIETVDGFKNRTPVEVGVDLSASYWVDVGDGRRLGVLMDAFNVLNLNRPTDYWQDTEIRFGIPNPDFGRITYYQVPRQLRLGVRFEF
jgi:hypothetical protein